MKIADGDRDIGELENQREEGKGVYGREKE